MITSLRALLIDLSLQPLLCALALSVILAAVTSVLQGRDSPMTVLSSERRWKLTARGLTAGAVFILAAHLAVVGWYISLPGFSDEVEPLIASISWKQHAGSLFYHELDAAEHYSILYGPTAFLTNGALMRLLGPSIPAAKAAGGLASVAGLAFLYLALRPIRGRRLALVLTALATLFYWSMGSFSYNSRPDPLLLAATSFGFLCAVRPRPMLAVAGVAAAIGFGANLKLHSGLFFGPVLILLGQRLGWRAAFIAASGGLALIMTPFLFHPAITVQNYLTWILQATRHGFDGVTFLRTLQMTVYFSLPATIGLLLFFDGGGVLRRRLPYLASLAAISLLVLLPASKIGAGPVHLMPLVPLAILPGAEFAAARQRRTGCWPSTLARGRLGAVSGLALAALLVGAITEYRCVRLTAWQNRNMAAVSEDIHRIIKNFPGHTMAMACGGEGEAFLLTYMRPLLVFAGQPLLLDPISAMESEFARQPLPAATRSAMAEGQIDIWLVPRGGEPFQKQNWYPGHRPVFSDDFREKFRRYHQLRDDSRFFDLWFHMGVPPLVIVQ